MSYYCTYYLLHISALYKFELFSEEGTRGCFTYLRGVERLFDMNVGGREEKLRQSWKERWRFSGYYFHIISFFLSCENHTLLREWLKKVQRSGPGPYYALFIPLAIPQECSGNTNKKSIIILISWWIRRIINFLLKKVILMFLGKCLLIKGFYDIMILYIYFVQNIFFVKTLYVSNYL